MKTSREDDFKPRPRVADYDELNAILRERTLAHAARTRRPEMKDKTILEVFEEERAALAPWQGPFDGYAETTAAVSKTCLATFDRNRYSVAAEAVGRPVQVRAHADRVVMLQDGAVVGAHARVFGRDRTVYDPWHYVPVLERKPGALRNGAPFRRMALPPAMARVQARLAGVDGGDRQRVDLLVAAHRQGVEAVEAACAEALQAGLRSADAILDILARRAAPPPVETVTPPAHLRPREEPVADCARYDRPIAEARHGAA